MERRFKLGVRARYAMLPTGNNLRANIDDAECIEDTLMMQPPHSFYGIAVQKGLRRLSTPLMVDNFSAVVDDRFANHYGMTSAATRLRSGRGTAASCWRLGFRV